MDKSSDLMYRIYKITNTINGKFYIGYTTNKLKYRFRDHCRSSEKHDYKSRLHSAIRKYGKENFSIELLAWGDNHKDGLNLAEPLLIEIFHPEYNLTKGGEGTVGYNMPDEIRSKKKLYRHTDEAKCRIREYQLGRKKGIMTAEHRKNLSISHMGKIQSESHVLKRVTSRNGYRHSEETKSKMRQAKQTQKA